MQSLLKRSRAVLAQESTGTNSKRPSQYVEGVYPTHLAKAQGPYVWDTSGNKYIDFVGGLGTIILGYNHPKVTEAVRKAMETGIVSSSLPHALEVEVGEIVQNMFPVCEKVRFLKTGSEACSASARIARAHTRSPKILSRGYHGHHDMWVSLTPPHYGVYDEFKVYKNLTSGYKKNVAAMIVEPLTISDDVSVREKLMENMKFCREIGALMIFDEVVTGCRVEGYSVAQMWGIDADIMCLGKAIANGFPLAIVGGKKDVMDSSEYFISSTYSGEIVSLAACKATLKELQTKNIKDLVFYAKRFLDQFNKICKPISVHINGYGTRGMLEVTDYNTALFMQEACKAGLLFGKAFFYNFAHLESGIEEYVFNIVSDIVEKVKYGNVSLEGEMPKETFAR